MKTAKELLIGETGYEIYQIHRNITLPHHITMYM